MLSYMLYGLRIDPGPFSPRQLYSAATNTKGRIVVGGFITTNTRFFNIIPHDDVRVYLGLSVLIKPL